MYVCWYYKIIIKRVYYFINMFYIIYIKRIIRYWWNCIINNKVYEISDKFKNRNRVWL